MTSSAMHQLQWQQWISLKTKHLPHEHDNTLLNYLQILERLLIMGTTVYSSGHVFTKNPPKNNNKKKSFSGSVVSAEVYSFFQLPMRGWTSTWGVIIKRIQMTLW